MAREYAEREFASIGPDVSVFAFDAEMSKFCIDLIVKILLQSIKRRRVSIEVVGKVSRRRSSFYETDGKNASWSLRKIQAQPSEFSANRKDFRHLSLAGSPIFLMQRV